MRSSPPRVPRSRRCTNRWSSSARSSCCGSRSPRRATTTSCTRSIASSRDRACEKARFRGPFSFLAAQLLHEVVALLVFLRLRGLVLRRIGRLRRGGPAQLLHDVVLVALHRLV